MADEKDTDPTRDGAVDGSDAAARSRRPAERPDEAPNADGRTEDSPLTPDSPTSAQSADSADEPETADELTDDFDEGTDDEAPDAQDSDDDRELVAVGARPNSSDRSGATRSTGGATAIGSGVQKKGRATPKQRTGTDRRKRTTPVEFVRGSVAELKKVVYPSRSQLGNYFVVVLVFVLIIIAIVTGLDYGFGWVMLKLFT